jgi:hypothetical protein
MLSVSFSEPDLWGGALAAAQSRIRRVVVSASAVALRRLIDGYARVVPSRCSPSTLVMIFLIKFSPLGVVLPFPTISVEVDLEPLLKAIGF